MSEIIKSEKAIDINALTLQQKAELDIQISTAKAFPRDIKKAYEQSIAMVTLNKDIADSCIYSLPRKNKEGKTTFITGPSVRAAEIMVSNWGNTHSGYRVIDNDGKHVTAEAVCWDLEKNNKITVQVKKSIRSQDKKTKQYFTYTEDMQTITGSAASSIAYRNAILRTLPRSFVDSVLKAAKEHNFGSTELLSSRVSKAINHFQKVGISENQLLVLIEKSNKEEITEDDLDILTGIKNALKDGAITVETLLNKETHEKKEKKSDQIINGLSTNNFDFKAGEIKEEDNFLEELGDIK